VSNPFVASFIFPFNISLCIYLSLLLIGGFVFQTLIYINPEAYFKQCSDGIAFFDINDYLFWMAIVCFPAAPVQLIINN
jgi:hypothetical protein